MKSLMCTKCRHIASEFDKEGDFCDEPIDEIPTNRCNGRFEIITLSDAGKRIHFDFTDVREGMGGPPLMVDPDRYCDECKTNHEFEKCPKCGSWIDLGFGLMFGGYGPYKWCQNDNCDWFYKQLLADDECYKPTVRITEEVEMSADKSLRQLGKVIGKSKLFYLIEKGAPGGTYWWKGLRAFQGEMNSYYGDPREGNHPFDSITNYPDLTTQDIDEAIQFRTREDAEAIWRLLPKEWRDIFIVTEHSWIARADSGYGSGNG